MNRKLKLTELNRVSVDEYKQQDKTPIVVILDNIRSLNNVGSFFRTSDAFNIEAIYLCGITATPPHREIQKTALGATDSVDWFYNENTIEVVDVLQTKGYKVYAIEQAENTISLENFNYNNEPIALVFGNEVKGVEQQVINAADGCIEIPQFGTKHSLNVSISYGVVAWHLVNQAIKK
ncbi:MAG: RNA methyltransferase [Flavobacteriales bacterium]|jgi:tRNA G18 (ribose-2'-O)-methylase SpoU|nr:RNA methyltransferase [Flavobacteriales bacterium]